MPQASSPPVSPNRRWLRALELTADVEAKCLTFPNRIDELAASQGDRPALLSDRECLTFAEFAARSNRYSRWGLLQDLPPGTIVGLMMPNRPDYIAAWTGLTRIGLTVALLNIHLTGAALAHCITVGEPTHLIVARDCSAALAGALPHLAGSPRIWYRHDGDLDDALGALSGAPLTSAERRSVALSDRALCIYTSGTTGLPKAANVSHRRIMTWSRWFAGLASLTPDDRMYDCLPLFHSVGGVVAPGCVLSAGGSVVIAERFSASRFWDDVARWDCTLFQYIGELCRYLVSAAPADGPPPPHRLRLCLGNGLRPDIWQAFKDRFAIPEILEFYAATEGSFSLVNVEGKVGSIGRIPPMLAHRFPAAIVRFDVAEGAPLRGSDGLCQRAAPDEAGEAIGRIGGGEGSGSFEGYTSVADSDAKVLRDVFAPGDRWFRTGDLMRRDAAGFFYFVDRIGDTFRWKGENVSTAEVAEVLMGAPGVVEATVYGVAVPGHDGRAGMAALVVGEAFDLPMLHQHLATHLPAYARPVFLRLIASIDATDTFKQRKSPLARDGFDPVVVTDPLFVQTRDALGYMPLDPAIHRALSAGEMRV
ncbi:MAG: long-chain-acyl-CoA synthetase [Janthinobacterium lividum]